MESAQESTQSRNQAPLMGILLLILITAVGGIVFGGIVAIVSKFIYLIILFPFLMAAAGGKLVELGVRSGRVRSRGMGILFGLLIGLTIYGTYRYGKYLLIRQELHDQLSTQAGSKVSGADIERAIDLSFQKKTGQTGFVGFTMLSAQIGVNLTFNSTYSSSSSGSKVTLPEPLTWVYWAVELLIVAGGAAGVAGAAASQPYCEQDNRFFFTLSLGRVQNASAPQFISAAKASDWRQASALIDRTRGKISYPYLEVRVDKCPTCNTNPLPLKVIRKRSSRSSNDSTLLKTTLTPAQFDELRATNAMPIGAVPA